MLRDAAFIARKDVKYTLRARESALWVFVMPIVFFYFIGTVTGGMGSRPRGTDKMAVMADTSSGFLADQLIHQLEERNYQVVLPDSISQFAAYARRLTVPASFTDSVLAGKAVALEFTNDTRGLNKDYHTIRTQRAVYTLLADFVVVKETEGKATPAGFDRLRETPRALQLTVTPAGERQRIPSGFEQAIPGIMVMFTLLVMGTSGAILLVLERKQGLLKRLAYTPIDRLGVVLGKWGGKWLVGIVQITFAMLAGTLLFKMDWGPDLPMVVVVMLIYGALMASIGVILG
ncbi:MAG: ABC transporter permease, partial [Candidatus Krumholzibacteria bacterium]|nr:ABC transporter permease [Candidatus Krumholzibacteria bacterium]